MLTDSHETPRPLPARPNLRHLKDQAKDLFKSGAAASLSDAQFNIARLYGFASWPKLQERVFLWEEFHAALEVNDVERIRVLANAEVLRLIRSGVAASLADAQAQVALLCGLKDWAELEAGLQTLAARESYATVSDEVRQLKRAMRRTTCSVSRR